MRAYLRRLDPGLSRPLWIVQLGALVNSVGSGLVMPFLVIYLHDVRGIGFGLAGLVVAAFGATTFVLTPVAGTVIDRVGPRLTLAAALVLLALGYGLFPAIRAPWQGLLFAGIAGVGNAAFWPSSSVLIVSASEGAERAAAFAVQRIVLNVGLALGGVIGGIVASTAQPGTFTVLFLANAASFLAFALLVPALPRPASSPEGASGTYRDVAADRPFLMLVGLNVVLTAAGYALFEAIVPAYTNATLGFSEHTIGFLFFLNMALVAGGQLPVLRAIEGRARVQMMALAALLWAAALGLVLITALWMRSTAAALALLVLAVVVFTAGELLHGPTQSALASDLAPDRLRGRYLSLVTASYALGYTLGPAAGGMLLAVSPRALWATAVFVLCGGGIALLALEQSIPAGARVAPMRQLAAGVPVRSE